MENQRNKRLADLEKSRELTYGSFNSNMRKIAKVWSVILDEELTQGVPLNPGIPGYKVALCYAAAKIIRASNNYHEDNYDDALSYLIEANNETAPNIIAMVFACIGTMPNIYSTLVGNKIA